MRCFKKNNLSVSRSIGLFFALLFFASCNQREAIPQAWLVQWENPPADYRPLKIAHNMDLRKLNENNKGNRQDPIKYLRDSCGLGGVVCNVEWGEDYLLSEKAWKKFVDGVQYMRENNMRVWIYDEDGYPSFSAGGRILENHPELESLEMAYDKSLSSAFYVRASYEYTHACNNFYEARRYPNPLNKLATERFIEVTHEAYLEHLGEKLFSEIEAFFTDEPSLMAANISNTKHSLKVQDPVDTTKKMLPVISWAKDIPGKYKQKYKEELTPHLLSLFEGDTSSDKEVRQKFWALIGELDRSYYYGAIQNWCREFRLKNQNKGPVSSGHGLREESIITHVPLDGNKLQCLADFDIPGLDFLDSDPKAWMKDNGSFAGNWQAAVLPVSAAQLTGKRRVMCEMSDFLQTMSGQRPANLEEMRASTAWQMAWGVTDFNLYYSFNYRDKYEFRNESSFKAYCDFVGRVNSVIMDAKPVKSVLLYYPIYDMQQEYKPVAGMIKLDNQPKRVQKIENSYHQIGLSLSKAQIPFIIVDYLFLENAEITNDGTIKMNGEEYSGLMLPQGVTLPLKVQTLVNQLKGKKGKVISFEQNTEVQTVEEKIASLAPIEKLDPLDSEIVFGKFSRSGHDIYMLVNTGDEIYEGNLSVGQKASWSVMNPQTGEVSNINSISEGRKKLLPVCLGPNQTLIYVSK